MSNDDNKTILLVEDEAVISIITVNILKRNGYGVITVNSGEEAVEKVISTDSINLVLMDINLGEGIDGAEAGRRILAVKNLPIVFHTSHSEREMVERVKGITRYGYVIKSSGDFVLLSSIEMAFELFETNRQFLEVEERLRLAISLGKIGYWRYDVDSNILKDYDEHWKLFGLSHDEGNKSLEDVQPLVHPEDRAAARNSLERTVNEGIPFDATYRTILPGIGTRWLHSVGSLHRTHNGKPGFVFGVTKDITEYKQADEELKKSEQKYSALFNNMTEGFALHEIVFDADGKPCDYRFLDINPAFEKLTGLKRDEITGRTQKEIMAEEDPFWLETYSRVALTGEPVHVEHYSHSLKKHFGVFSYCPVPGQFAVIFSDITIRKIAEDESIQSGEQFKNLVYDMQVGVLLQGPQAEILLSNPKALELLGLSEDQLLGKTSFDPDWNVIHEDGSPFPGPDHPVPQAIATSQSVRKVIMGVYRPAIGDRIWLLVDAVPQFSGEGALIHVVCTFIDISDRKSAEEKINNLLREKELLIKEVHHRIKNNMNSINGLFTLQAATLKDNAVVTALEDAANRVRSMMVLYDKLYQSSETKEISVKNYIPSLVDEIITNFPNCMLVNVDKEIGDFVLDLKKLQPLGIIINELLTNIMKYAFTGRVDGTISVSAELKDTYALIVISDNGNGLPLSVDFENPEGFGLKLVKLLAEQMDGSIRVERGEGTKFLLEFSI